MKKWWTNEHCPRVKHRHIHKLNWLNERCTQSAKVAKEIHIRMKWIDMHRPFKNYKPWEKKERIHQLHITDLVREYYRTACECRCMSNTDAVFLVICVFFYAFSCTSGQNCEFDSNPMTRKKKTTKQISSFYEAQRIEPKKKTLIQRKYINYVTLHMQSNLNSLFKWNGSAIYWAHINESSVVCIVSNEQQINWIKIDKETFSPLQTFAGKWWLLWYHTNWIQNGPCNHDQVTKWSSS